MKKIILLVANILITLSLQAQTIPYEKLDSISSEISKLQLKANNLPYKDAKGNEYEISFSDKNFEVFFYNQLAFKSVYKKWDGKEILALTENIDLSKVTAITKHTSFTDVVLIKLYFPTGYLKTQLFENGILTNTITEEYLEFFTTNSSREKLANSLYDLVVLFKITKGLTTEEKMTEERIDYTALSKEDFLKKYPNSLLAKQAQLIIKEKEDKQKNKIELEEKERKEAAIKYEKAFISYNYFQYKTGLTMDETIKAYPELALKYVKNKTSTPGGELISKNKNFIFYVKDDFVYGYFGEIASVRFEGGYRETDIDKFSEIKKDFDIIKNNLIREFNFSPSEQILDSNAVLGQHNTSFTWVKNNKTIRLQIVYKQKDTLAKVFYSYTISIFSIDENLTSPNADRWGNSQNNTVNLLKSDNTTNTTTSIPETSTLDERTKYDNAKIDYKAGTISKDDYKVAIKKYSQYASYESLRLQKAFRDKEITRAEYTQAIKILLRK
jgi:hypothetical protein